MTDFYLLLLCAACILLDRRGRAIDESVKHIARPVAELDLIAIAEQNSVAFPNARLMPQTVLFVEPVGAIR